MNTEVIITRGGRVEHRAWSTRHGGGPSVFVWDRRRTAAWLLRRCPTVVRRQMQRCGFWYLDSIKDLRP